MMKNAYFILKVIFVLTIFNFCPDVFGPARKRLANEKAKINFKTFDTTTWEINNYNTHIVNIRRSKYN